MYTETNRLVIGYDPNVHRKREKTIDVPQAALLARKEVQKISRSHVEIMCHLKNVECEVPKLWISAYQAHVNGSGILYVDTEFASNRLVQVAILDATGNMRLNVRIDHCVSIQTLYDELPESGFQRAIGVLVLDKFYGTDSVVQSPMMTIDELTSKLIDLRLSESILVEWSVNYCDYNQLARALAPTGKVAQIMPPITRRLSALHLYRARILRQHASYALQAIYPFLLPTSKLLWTHHEAEVDTKKLYNVVELAFSVAKPFASQNIQA